MVLLLAACPAPRRTDLPRRRTPTLRPPPEVRRFVPPEAYRQFLLAELSRGRLDNATSLRHMRQALVEDPGSPYLRLRIAELLLARGRLTEALTMTKAALRVAPSYAPGYVLRGRLLADDRTGNEEGGERGGENAGRLTGSEVHRLSLPQSRRPDNVTQQ